MFRFASAAVAAVAVNGMHYTGLCDDFWLVVTHCPIPSSTHLLTTVDVGRDAINRIDWINTPITTITPSHSTHVSSVSLYPGMAAATYVYNPGKATMTSENLSMYSGDATIGAIIASVLFLFGLVLFVVMDIR